MDSNFLYSQADDYSAGKITQIIPDVVGADLLNVYDFNTQGWDFITVKGTANGQNITSLVINPLSDNNESIITSKIPMKVDAYILSLEASINQRIRHQYTFVESVTNEAYVAPTEFTLASIQQATTTLTLITNSAVDWKIGDWVNIWGVTDNRLNYPNFVVATISLDMKTITGTVSDEGTIPSLTVWPYTNQGSAQSVSQLRWSEDGIAMRFSGTNATTCAYITKFGGNEAMQSGTFTGSQTVTCWSTAPVFISGATGQVDIKATNRFYIASDYDSVTFSDVGVNNATIRSIRTLRTWVKPWNQHYVYARFRTVSPRSMTRPIAKVISSVKTGTTTATVTTDVAHWLTAGFSYVTLKGQRDQTWFAVFTTPAVVVSTPTTTSFTIVYGTAVTATTYGGSVILCQGWVDQPGIIGQTIQSVARDANWLVTLIGSASWSGLNIGEYTYIHGVRDNATGADLGFDGSYEVATVSTTTLILKPVRNFLWILISPSGWVITTTNCWGTVILMTTLRSHAFGVSQYTPNFTSILRQGTNDLSKALPIYASGGALGITNAASISSSDWSGGVFIRPGILVLTDITSAAITTSSTTSSISNSLGNSFQVTIPVTAVTGTNPTMDVTIEESMDGGTNWVTLYQFQRIIATGSYNSPILRATGRNIRYVQTIGGATPSFTRAVFRNILPFHNAEPQKRVFDRAINVNSINATSVVLFAGAANNVQLTVNMWAITTTAPQFKIQGSEDNTNWYDISTTPLTAVASSTVQQTIPTLSATFVRAIESTAGSGATLGYLSLKAWS